MHIAVSFIAGYHRRVRMTILTLGSRGDVQPYVALGAGLQRAGHAVRLPGPEVFRDLIGGAGLEYVPVQSMSPQEFIRNPEIQAAVRRGGQLNALVALLRHAGPLLEGIFDEMWRTSADAELIVAGTLLFGAVDAAEARSLPSVYAPLHALQPTGAFPNPFAAPFGVSRWRGLNRLSHQVLRHLMWQMFRGALNRWRRKMGLKPHGLFDYYRWVDRRRLPTIYGFSPSVLPLPDDWPEWHHVTGYWFLDEPASWQPPADLVHFLEAGPPPVYVGFGSMDDQNPERITRVVVEALARSGRRGILLSGWGGLGEAELPATIYRAESLPHSWLFPRMAAVVHHGGAGTTAAGLRAGVPSVITPLSGDQPFWAERVKQLGVGVRGEPFFRVTPERLATDITRAVTDAGVRQRAEALGAQIRSEDGVGQAVQVIGEYVAGLA